MIKKIISGGQTGVDQIGLQIGELLGLETGGMIPKGYLTENGPDPTLARYGLIESTSTSYNIRTSWNIKNSNGTIIFGDVKSPGTALTIRMLIKASKPYICNPSSIEVEAFIKENDIKTLNVAGNRGSKLIPFQENQFANILMQGLIKCL